MNTSTSSSAGENIDEDFFQEVYNELRQLAHAKMSKEYVYSTLQGTALVNEAWLKMGGENQPRWQNRAHFFGAAAEAMRRILVDRARKRKAKKHGGDLQRADPEALDQVTDELQVDDQLLQINEALEKLQEVYPEKAELVKLRYFFGMSFDKTAETMGISVSTAKRSWDFSRAWLRREISGS